MPLQGGKEKNTEDFLPSPLGFRGGADAARSRLAPGSFLTRLTPAEPVHRLMANGRLCSRDNMLRHLFDKGAF